MLNLTIEYGLVNIVQFGFSSLPTYDGVNPSMLLKLFPDYGEFEIEPRFFFITVLDPLSIVLINGSPILCQLLLENNLTTLFLWMIKLNLGDVYNIAWSGHQSNWLLAGETNPPIICSPQIKSVIEFHFLAEAQLLFDQNLFLSQALLLDL